MNGHTVCERTASNESEEVKLQSNGKHELKAGVGAGRSGRSRWGTFPSFAAVSIGILVSYAIIHMYQDRIDSYQFVKRSGIHDPNVAVPIAVVYLMAIYWLIPMAMKDRSPKSLVTVKIVHNYFLTVISFVGFAKIFVEILGLWFEKSGASLFWKFEALLCDSENNHARNNNLYFWFYVYYISKFYELIDTVFICFANKKPIFLHVYHHFIVLYTMWLGLEYNYTTQLVIVPANFFVHILMYYYYMLQSMGVSIWWKRYLTTLQIGQFIFDEVAILSWPYFVLVAGLSCQSNWPLFFYACGIVNSILFLFLVFYSKTYSSKRGGNKLE